MKVYVLGHKGMLGTYVYTYLLEKGFENGYSVYGISRSEIDASEITEDELFYQLYKRKLKSGDVIINCIGTIKPQVDKLGVLNAIKVNSEFPHLLANVCESMEVNLIHITTDCVFSGDDGNYKENSPHDCLDVYGKTKSLGEPENCTVIRTSIIGEEFGENKRSLIEWVKSQEGKTVNGYLNHQWNGITCRQAAKVFEQIIRNNQYWKGVVHVSSEKSLSKYELVKAIAYAHNINVNVVPVDGPTKCDRTLYSNFSEDWNIPDIPTQLEEQYKNPPNKF